MNVQGVYQDLRERESQLVVEKALFSLVDLLRCRAQLPAAMSQEQLTRWRNFIARVDLANQLLEQTLTACQQEQPETATEPARKRRKSSADPAVNKSPRMPAAPTIKSESPCTVLTVGNTLAAALSKPQQPPATAALVEIHSDSGSDDSANCATPSSSEEDDGDTRDEVAALLASQVLCDISCSGSSPVCGPAPAPAPAAVSVPIPAPEPAVPSTAAPVDNSRKPGKRRGKLPRPATNILKSWLFAHTANPYPSEEEKEELARSTCLSMGQVNNWFTNARRRLLPRSSPEAAAVGFLAPAATVRVAEPRALPLV
eukprot:TRINITY_DN4379_c0_g2_i1.p1 TRINITY_DN4379_c0_g2~~TRINITY_DN4379_c0_g2_i1.p1  ORF type:complete len:314 (-),score=75.31 TRINITY_DN4379_c0_g2_i1:93-1034(-)